MYASTGPTDHPAARCWNSPTPADPPVPPAARRDPDEARLRVMAVDLLRMRRDVLSAPAARQRDGLQLKALPCLPGWPRGLWLRVHHAGDPNARQYHDGATGTDPTMPPLLIVQQANGNWSTRVGQSTMGEEDWRAYPHAEPVLATFVAAMVASGEPMLTLLRMACLRGVSAPSAQVVEHLQAAIVDHYARRVLTFGPARTATDSLAEDPALGAPPAKDQEAPLTWPTERLTRPLPGDGIGRGAAAADAVSGRPGQS